jgi:glutamine amidotransferase
LLPGKVKLFPASERVPQIGWNQIAIQQPCALLDGIEEGSFFYFVHSYYVEADEQGDSVATTDYGLDYTSIAARENVFGVQFHPEKSQKIGLRLLANFAALN